MINLDAYYQRIGFGGQATADLETLQALHLAHATHIPFENLDIQLGLPIRLDLAALQDKLVRRRRGGYCFEQNTLFQAVLEAIGFAVIPGEARVRRGASGVLARTHMVLLVQLEGGLWLCDVGFGADGLLLPLPLDGEPHRQFQGSFRVDAEGPLRVLRALQAEGWQDLYAFLPEARYPIDFEMANHFTSTYPESRFVKTLTAQLPGPDGRRVLRGRVYTEIRDGAVVERTLTPTERLEVLRTCFGLELPKGVGFSDE